MANIRKIVFFIFLLIVGQVYCQTTKLVENRIVGTWQKDSKIIGSGLAQYFRFFSNDKFVFKTSSFEDARMLNALKGNYKLKDNKLFFKITSKIINNGNVEIGEPGFEPLFQMDGKLKKVVIKHPKTIDCEIKFISDEHIVINNENYYKVSNNPNF